MWPHRTLVVVLLGVLVAGCGQQQSQRAAVAAYLKNVNKLEAALATPLSTVTATGNQFAHEQTAGGTLTNLLPASQEQALLKAWAQIRAVRGRLASVKVPAPARHLHALLLEIMDGQAALTREVAQLVVFLPHYNAALHPLVGATKQLELALSQQTAVGTAAVAQVYAAKSAALRRFAADVDGVLRRLGHLQPPAVSAPGFRSQVSALRGMSSAAGQLANSLGGGPQGNVSQLLVQFDRAATSNQTVAAQKAQIAAVKAYDGASTRLAKLTQAAELERLRLANTLS